MKNSGWCFISTAVAVIAVSLVAAPASGQSSPATAATWQPARTPDGQPDMQGIWTPHAANANHSLEEGAEPQNRRVQGRSEAEIARELATQPKLLMDPTDGKLPYRSEALGKRTEHLENLFTPTKWEHIEPDDRCLLEGVPRTNYRSDWQIIQTPGYVVILYEWVHAYRVIPIDGHPHVGDGIKLWHGDSRGRWEGQTLVVDVTNHNDKTWFDSHGSYHTDTLHVVERFTLVDANTIKYEATVEDPAVFTRPWKIAMTAGRRQEKDYELLEESCHEGERNVQHMLEGGRALKAAGVRGIHTHK